MNYPIYKYVVVVRNICKSHSYFVDYEEVQDKKVIKDKELGHFTDSALANEYARKKAIERNALLQEWGEPNNTMALKANEPTGNSQARFNTGSLSQ